MLDSLTLDQIRVLLAVADTGSFSKAAQQLNRAQSAVTSGAVGGAKVAAYLKGDGAAVSGSEKILERFTAPMAVKEEPIVTQSSAPAVNEQKLASLTQVAPTQQAIVEKAEESAKPADLTKANEKLSSLLGGKK